MSFALVSSKKPVFALLSVTDRYGTLRLSLEAGERWSVRAFQASVTQQCQKRSRQRSRSRSLAVAFPLSSRARRWGIPNVSIVIPLIAVASVEQSVPASHSKLFTRTQHWQQRHRMAKSVYAVCQVCLHVPCQRVCVCMCSRVCRSLQGANGNRW